MTISRTVTGLFDQCSLDLMSEMAWNGIEYGVLDTVTKREGAASHKFATGGPVYWESGAMVGSMARAYNFGTGAIFRIWLKKNFTAESPYVVHMKGYVVSPEPPAVPDFTEYLVDQSANEDWTLYSHTMTHVGYFIPRFTYWIAGGPEIVNGTCWLDHLVICKGTEIKVNGLHPDMKIELYRASDNALLDTETVAGGEDHIHFDITAEDFPYQMYLKIYSTDGVTLLETSPSYDMCGGDEWEWTADVGTLTMTSASFIIYRSGATATPKTSAIIANLKTPAGANYPDATIYFSATNGSVAPATNDTDASGNAHSTLTSTANHGISIVKAEWLGDANVPACAVFVTIHVFYEAEAGDEDIEFQCYIEGYLIEYDSGRYAINSQGKPEDFEVEIPEWDSNITPYGIVSIYRKGVQEFAGICLKPDQSLSESPRVVLTGFDLTYLLSDAVCDLKVYNSKTPQYMIADLLSTFPCGITAGSLGTNPDSLTLTIDTENLLAAIQRICDNVYWNFRVNLDRTLDLAEYFGGGPSGATFVEGENVLSLDRIEDYSQIKNWVRMRGNGITSTKQDGVSIMEHGLHQTPSFQSTITSQATLDAACQALLDLLKEKAEMIPLEAIDTYAPGTLTPEATVWVTSTRLDMDGEYTIKRIERDMTDPNYVRLELSNRLTAYWELDAAYHRMIKDVSV